MYKARTIGKQVTTLCVCAAILLFASLTLFSLVREAKQSSQYYWSSDARESASVLSNFATLCVIGGIASLIGGISLSSLKNTGRVCPRCEVVYSSGTVICPTCGVDLHHAKKVDEYLAENPVAPAVIPPADNVSVSGVDNGEENSGKRFCGNCGGKITGEDAFCPHCGAKQ